MGEFGEWSVKGGVSKIIANNSTLNTSHFTL